MNRRERKQLIFAGIVLVITAITIFVFWRISLYTPGSCADNIQNQDEIGVDCGGICPACVGLPEPPRLSREPIIVPGESGTYDALFHIENVNPQWGIRELPYTLHLKDINNEIVGSREGKTYLLPLEDRIVVEQAIPLDSPGKVISGNITFGEPKWAEVIDSVRSDDLVVLNTIFSRLKNLTENAEVRGIIRNDSPFSYDRVDVFVVISDASDNIISARRTEMRTLSSGERREFRIAWRTLLDFPAEPRVHIDAFTNVFENENFVRKHGVQEQFQELR